MQGFADGGMPEEQPYRGENLGPLSREGVPNGNPEVLYDPAMGTQISPNVGESAAAPEPQGVLSQMANRLMGTQFGEPRYQLWPEKMIRSGATLAGDVLSGEQPVIDPDTGRTSEQLIERAQDMAGMAGTGGLAGIEPGAAGVFGGKLAQNANLKALRQAEALHADGVAPEHIWQNTGWFMGRDDKWRFEMPDDKAGFKRIVRPGTIDNYPITNNRITTVGEAFQHPQLHEAYPNLHEVPLEITDKYPGFRGAHTMDSPALEGGERVYLSTKDSRYGQDMLDARSTMLHELQHAIQSREGFVTGGNTSEMAEVVKAANDAKRLLNVVNNHNIPLEKAAQALNEAHRGNADIHPAAMKLAQTLLPEDLARIAENPFDAYKRLSGEVEARNVQFRQPLSEQQRRVEFPFNTEDVPAELQTLGRNRPGRGDMSASMPMLRPALKYEGKIYKAPMTPDAGHIDAIPQSLYPTFQKQAMSGEDISNFNFGFINHKGQFISREAALQYAIEHGMVDPSAAQQGALTSTLLADSSKPGAAIEAVAQSQKPLYSAVERALENAPQQKMHPQQWLGWLKNQPGVKAEELAHLGLTDPAALPAGEKGLVTRGDLLSHVKDNGVEIGEVVKAELPENFTQLPADKQYELADHYRDVYGDGRPPGLDDLQDFYARSRGELSPTKYSDYQLPGGDNYREHLLTLPEAKMGPKEVEARDLTKRMQAGEFNQLDEAGRAKFFARLEKLNSEMNAEKASNNPYKSSHWDEPNVLAHIRTNDRTFEGGPSFKLRNKNSGNTTKAFDTVEEAQAHLATLPEKLRPDLEVVPAGNRPVKALHLEELQSDAQQAWRKAQQHLSKYVDDNFDSLAAKMVQDGVIKKVCD